MLYLTVEEEFGLIQGHAQREGMAFMLVRRHLSTVALRRSGVARLSTAQASSEVCAQPPIGGESSGATPLGDNAEREPEGEGAAGRDRGGPGPRYRVSPISSLTARQRTLLDAVLRVDLAGELAAVRIYEGQLAVLGRGPEKSTLEVGVCTRGGRLLSRVEV